MKVSRAKFLGPRSAGRISGIKNTFKEFSKLHGVIEASFIAFIAITALGIYDFIIPLFTENFAESLAIIGLVISLGYVISFLVEVPVGKLTDRIGRIKVLLLSLLCLGITGIFFYFAQNIWQVAVLVLAFGFSQILFWVPSTVLIRDFSPKNLMSQSQGIYLTFSQLGWILGPLIAGFVTGMYSDRHNFLIYAAFLFIALFATAIIFRKPKKGKTKVFEGTKGRKRKARLTFLIDSFKTYIFAHKHASPLYFLSFASYVFIATEWTFVVLAGTRVFGFTAAAVGIILAAMMAVEAVLFYTSGFLMDKIGKKYIITGGLLLLFTSAYFAFLATTPAMFVLFLLLAAGSLSWILPGTEGLLTEIMPADIMGEMSGVFDTSKDLGFIVGPFVGGLLAEMLFGPLTPFLFVAILAGIGAFLAGFVFWPQYNKPKRKSKRKRRR